jgi:methionine synthase II (cobalamin-independent)
MPGGNPAESAAVVFGELPDFPYIPELPDRGPGADMIGRAAALLVDLPADTVAGRWKLATRPGRDQRRAGSYLSSDLDAAEEAAGGFQGALKVQVCGPWTLAAAIERSRSQDPVLTDPGAIADLTASLAEGVAAHVADVRKRIPGATVILQIDEPSLPAALAGSVPTASGLNRVGAIDATVAAGGLRDILTAGAAASAAAAATVVHCCAPGFPFAVVRDAGARAVSFDLGQLRGPDTDQIAETAEAGLGLLIGAVSEQDAKLLASDRPEDPRPPARRVIGLWQRIGLPLETLAAQVVVTPACGLAGMAPAAARAVLELCREAARGMPELIEEGPQ